MVAYKCLQLSYMLAQPLREQLYQALICKHILAPTIVSGISVCWWDGSQGRQSLDGLSFNLWFIFCPSFSLDGNNSRLKILRWVTGPFPHMGTMPIHWGWSLKVLSRLWCTCCLRPSTLSPVSRVNSILLSIFLKECVTNKIFDPKIIYPFGWERVCHDATVGDCLSMTS